MIDSSREGSRQDEIIFGVRGDLLDAGGDFDDTSLSSHEIHGVDSLAWTKPAAEIGLGKRALELGKDELRYYQGVAVLPPGIDNLDDRASWIAPDKP